MHEDRFADLMRRAAPSFNAPPEPPLDAMWERIAEAHFDRRRGRRIPIVWTRTLIGLAASLLVGIAIGRFSARPEPSQVVTAASESAAPPPATTRELTGPYAAATTRYLGEAATLLIAFPEEARASRPDSTFVSQARELLSTTRVLLDSPAASSEEVRTLLGDLELILAQIARLPAQRDSQEVDFITEALEQREVLTRLRNVAAELPYASGT
jgi:hypothetical protein